MGWEALQFSLSLTEASWHLLFAGFNQVQSCLRAFALTVPLQRKRFLTYVSCCFLASSPSLLWSHHLRHIFPWLT